MAVSYVECLGLTTLAAQHIQSQRSILLSDIISEPGTSASGETSDNMDNMDRIGHGAFLLLSYTAKVVG